MKNTSQIMRIGAFLKQIAQILISLEGTFPSHELNRQKLTIILMRDCSLLSPLDALTQWGSQHIRISFFITA